jgi:hypothetical protein
MSICNSEGDGFAGVRLPKASPEITWGPRLLLICRADKQPICLGQKLTPALRFPRETHERMLPLVGRKIADLSTAKLGTRANAYRPV